MNHVEKDTFERMTKLHSWTLQKIAIDSSNPVRARLAAAATEILASRKN